MSLTNDLIVTHIIDCGNNGQGMTYPEKGKHKLVITHSAGFFSCNTIALCDIVIWSRKHKQLPDILDRHAQYGLYKSKPNESLIDRFFKVDDSDIDCSTYFELSYEDREFQYIDYRNLLFDNAVPFVNKYFAPSDEVMSMVKYYETKYNIDYEKTCAVFYRGNDKNRETVIADYDKFISKANEFKDLRFLVQPDETEFLQAFTSAFPNSFNFDETPHISKKDSAVFYEMPTDKRADFAVKFFAAVIVMSRCKHLITHTGNCGLWACLYRGNMNNVHQIRDNQWL